MNISLFFRPASHYCLCFWRHFCFFVSSWTDFTKHYQIMLLFHLNPSMTSQCKSKLFTMAYKTLHDMIPATHLPPCLMLLFLLPINIQLHWPSCVFPIANYSLYSHFLSLFFSRRILLIRSFFLFVSFPKSF